MVYMHDMIFWVTFDFPNSKAMPQTYSQPMLNKVFGAIHHSVEHVGCFIQIGDQLHRKRQIGRPHMVIVIDTLELAVLIVPTEKEDGILNDSDFVYGKFGPVPITCNSCR